jgi:hypothetical protein
MYTVIEKARNGERVQKIATLFDAKQIARGLKQKTKNECNVLSDGIAVWTTDGETHTDAIYFM